MTISAEYSIEVFPADTGANPEYAFTFEFAPDSSLRVVLFDSQDNPTEVNPSSYTVTLEESFPTAQGGTVTFASAHPVSTVKVGLFRVTDITQLLDYAAYTAFPTDTHEAGLDKLTLICQEIADRVEYLESLNPPQGVPDP